MKRFKYRVLSLLIGSMLSSIQAMEIQQEKNIANAHLGKSEYSAIRPSSSLTVNVVKDIFSDSASITLYPYGVIKKSVQEQLSKITGHTELRRILALDGGGIRGLFSIIKLSVLEEIINCPINQEKKEEILSKSNSINRRLYIKDIFDVGAGTSTGSILTAGLFSIRNYSATDVAKLYARYGYKIFGEQKRLLTPGINVGFISATYSNKGLKELLDDHFGNDTLQNVYKPIYIIGLNESKQSAAIFSTNKLHGDADDLHKTPLREAILCSSSAPTFFPGVNIQANNDSYFMSDGGTVANNPAYTAYQQEKKTWGNPFEIYSFGTGLVPSPEVRSLDSGLRSVAAILTNILVAGENLAYKKCVDEIESISSQLHYFARINPKLEKGMDKLDDTRDPYIGYAIQKALSLTGGGAFANMVSQLGFNMPTSNALTGIHETIRHKLDSLKSKTYGDLDKYEKEFVMKKVLDLDFNFYQKSFYQDAAGEVQQMTHEEAKAFLENLIQDIAEKRKTEDGFIFYLWRMVSTSDADSILEFIPRCLEFHTIVKTKITPLTSQDFNLLQDRCELTKDQVKSLSDTSFISDSNIEMAPTNRLVFNLLKKFIECCNDTSFKYNYSSDIANYIELPALIFWKEALKDTENQLTRNELVKLKENLDSNVLQIIQIRSWVFKKMRSSRYKILVKALETYTGKFFGN